MNIEALQTMLERLGEDRCYAASPWRLGEWLVATDGRGLLAIRSTEEAAPAPKDIEGAAKWLEKPLANSSFDLASLRTLLPAVDKWCAACRNRGTIPCKTCEGSGTVACTCDECGNDHDRQCDDCSGRKTFPCPNGCAPEKAVYGWLDGALFDLALLAQYLAPVPDGPCHAKLMKQGTGDALYVGNDDWRLILMACHSGRDESGAVRFSLAEGKVIA